MKNLPAFLSHRVSPVLTKQIISVENHENAHVDF